MPVSNISLWAPTSSNPGAGRCIGQRVAKTVSGETTHFLYGLKGQLLEEATGAGTPVRDYIYLGDMLLAMVDVEEAPPQADMALTMTGIRSGTSLTYTMTARNNGPSSAENVAVVNTIAESKSNSQAAI